MYVSKERKEVGYCLNPTGGESPFDCEVDPLPHLSEGVDVADFKLHYELVWDREFIEEEGRWVNYMVRSIKITGVSIAGNFSKWNNFIKMFPNLSSKMEQDMQDFYSFHKMDDIF